MIDPTLAWTILILGYVVPLIHVLIKAPAGHGANDRCPFSPRSGWVVLVLLIGPIGWLLFMHSRRQLKSASPTEPSDPGPTNS